MHPHIPRPRRKATRTCTDTAGVVRTVHGEFMWPFTARVNEQTAPIERIAAVAICRRLRDARGRIYAPPSTANALLAGIAAGRCPLYRQKRTLIDGIARSALYHKRTHALQQKRVLLDHNVDELLELPSHFQAEPIRSLEVNHTLELCRPLNGKLARGCPEENSIDVTGSPQNSHRRPGSRSCLSKVVATGQTG